MKTKYIIFFILILLLSFSCNKEDNTIDLTENECQVKVMDTWTVISFKIQVQALEQKLKMY